MTAVQAWLLLLRSKESESSMSVREIAPADWASFLEQFSREHRAWLATLERVSEGGLRQAEFVDRTLDSVSATASGPHAVSIIVRFGTGKEPVETVNVDAPAALRVEETREGAARGLEIEDDTGECTRLTFRGAAPPDL
jgi:hypothetical protein